MAKQYLTGGCERDLIRVGQPPGWPCKQRSRQMAKGKRKARTEAEIAEIEADRVAAHEAVTPSPEDVAAYEEQQAEEGKMSAEELFEVLAEPDEHADEDQMQEEIEEQADEEGDAEEKPEPNSVVKDKFKVK